MNEIIKTQNLGKIYTRGDEKIYALQDISFQIRGGDYVAFIGPSGSGKSTMMNIIGCLDTPSFGTYFLDQEDVSDLEGDNLAHIRNKAIGFVFQTFNLLSGSNALDNVALPLIYAGFDKKQREERAYQALEKVGLANRASHLPSELSGGQRQRVAIARALVNNPTIILADEPTGNLDTNTSYEIMEIFKELNDQGNTILIVTHENDIADRARRVIKLVDGKIESDYLNEGARMLG